ncbi:S-adenosylmethionine carrier 1, chloroplastic/mitochondrial isoform X1 [Cajanus cajan]|nr:S-adenosylmethionine carrier 1, chloroplastic/mitochondrial isoform X1 [Cajanus cajan]
MFSFYLQFSKPFFFAKNPYKTLEKKSQLVTCSMAVRSSTSREAQVSKNASHGDFFLWKEFVWGAVAGAFGEGMMHPVDTIKTRLQSQAILNGIQNQKNILQMVQSVWQVDGLKGFYRGVAPGIIGSLATGATYFGVIESTKKWIEDSHPSLRGHWAHFIAGAVGDTLGSFVYVPCEVMKQRMQVQGTITSWSSVAVKDGVAINSGTQMYGYYTGMFHAGCSIWKTQGLKGLYAGYLSTLARDVPFAGLMVMFYEALKDAKEQVEQRWISSPNWHVNNSVEGLVLGGLAGGLSAYLTTPLDVVKTRLQVQGSTLRYTGWLDAIGKIWATEGMKGMFRGSIPRITWYIPASALTFMAVEFLRGHFKDKSRDVGRLLVDKKSLQGGCLKVSD